MSDTVWSFNATITHPDGTEVSVLMTVPKETAEDWKHRANHAGVVPRSAPEPVLECSELAQMGAARAMSAYAAAKLANESRELPF